MSEEQKKINDYWKRVCILPLVTVAVMLLFCLWMVARKHMAEKQVQPGSVWTYDLSNPFEKCIITNTVIAVKGGWVQYSSSYGMVKNDEISWFLSGSKKKRVK